MRKILFLWFWSLGLAAALATDPGLPVYPSDSFARPTVDAIPVFEDFCGVTAAIASPLEQKQKFKTHRLQQIDWRGGKATEWEFQAKPGIPPPAILSLSEQFNRSPQGASITIQNLGKTSVETVLQLNEVAWWTDSKRAAKSILAVGTPKLAPGETRQVHFVFDTTGLHAPLTMAFLLRDPNQTDDYHLVLSNLKVSYPSETAVTGCKLAFPSPLVAGKPVAIALSGSGFHANDQIDLQLGQGRWILWRIRLSPVEKQALEKSGATDIRRTVPWYLPTRQLTATVVTPRGMIDASTTPVSITNPLHADLPQMKRETVGGLPVFTKNGEPMPYSGYSSYDFEPGNVGEMGAHGANMFLVPTNAGRHVYNVTWPTWRADGRFDFSQLDESVTTALAANPDANLIMRVSLSLPPFWFARHPEARALVRKKGRNYVWQEAGGVVATYTSKAWREQQAANLREMISYIRGQPWAGRVAGIFLCGGVTEEWFAWGANNAQCGDYSPPQQDAFREWCARKGLPWTQVPEPEDRTVRGTAFYPDTAAGRQAAAYQQFISESTAQTIDYFGDVVKKATEGRSLAGVFYGYFMQLAGESRQSLSGVFGVKELLDDPDIDFISGVPMFAFRSLESGYYVEGGLNASVRTAGKVSEDEDDLFSWLHGGAWNTAYNPSDPRAGAISMHRRVFSGDAVNGNDAHLFSLFASWHHDEQLQQEFAREARIQTESLKWNRSPGDEIALVVDETSMGWITPYTNYLGFANTQELYAAARTGAPVGVYLLSDIDKLPDTVRMIVVAYAVAPKAQDLARLKACLARGGRTIVIIGPAGLIDADTQHWNDGGPADLTGLPIVMHREGSSGIIQLSSTHRQILDMSLSSGGEIGADGQWHPEISRVPVSPYATIDGPGWAQYVVPGSATPPTAGTERPLANHGRLIWSALPVTDPQLMRSWAEDAGVRFYAPLNCTVHAGEDVLSVTSPAAGQVTVHWPGSGQVIDQFDGTRYSGPDFECPFELGQTRLFVRQNEPRSP